VDVEVIEVVVVVALMPHKVHQILLLVIINN
jgi:hypothetical protein